MTRQDVPKLTGTPRRPRRAEPPAPTASRFPYRSLFRPREPCAQPRVRQPRFVSNTRSRDSGDRRVFFRFRVWRFFYARRDAAVKRR